MIATLLSSVLVTGAGTSLGPVSGSERSYQASVTGSGTVTTTVLVQVSNDNVNWVTQGTITLTGTTTATDGYASMAQWEYVRGNVSAVSGTGAAVTLIMSVSIQS